MGRHARLAVVALATMAFAAYWASGVSAAGKLRFYIDKNRSFLYDAGEGYNGGWADYKQKDSNSLVSARLGADGSLAYQNAKQGDKLFCRYKAHTQAAAKGNHANVGSMFDLYLDTDAVANTGEVVRETLNTVEADWVNLGNTLNVRLEHPTLSWNLLVCLDWDASSSYISKLKSGFKKASNYLYDCTDGQMKLGKIDIRENVAQSSQLWADADTQISAGTKRPRATVDGITGATGHIYMSRFWGPGSSTTSGDPDKSIYYRAFIHELGHYALSFWDEYIDGNGSETAWPTYRKNHKNEVPGNYGLMDNPYDSSEMSSNNDYLANYAAGTAANQVTNQIWSYNLYLGGGVHRPCWQTLLDRFDNRNGTQTNWGGYGGIRLAFVPPDQGVYQGRNNKGQEVRTSSDRGKPEKITQTFYAFVEWEEAEFFGASLAATSVLENEGEVELTVVGPSGSPARGARVWLETADDRRIEQGWTGPDGIAPCAGVHPGDTLCASFDGRIGRVKAEGDKATIDFRPAGRSQIQGIVPKIMLEGFLSISSANHIVRIKLVSDTALTGLPTVYVRPGFGSQVPVTMSPAGTNTFMGAINVGSNVEGGVDVSATSAGGTTQTSTTFRIDHLDPDGDAVIHGQDGRLEVRLPRGILTQETHSITMGSGNAPIPLTDPSLICLPEPFSFHLQDGVTVGSIFTANWLFDRDTLVGRDALTTTMRRFDTALRSWLGGGYAFRPGYRVVTGQSIPAGVYAVFMRDSPDVTPPGQVTNLYAMTGESSQSVQLFWTSPGDDGAAGQAVRYNILFNTEPIAPENLEDCKTLQVIDEPKAAGQLEEYGFDMPDPDTVHFFVIQAQDEAENLGPVSNVAMAKSYVQDTDGDGLSDQWEEAHGMDPDVPGDQGLDPDSDGLTNIEEYQLGTIPTDPDSDDDGLSDGLEVAASTNPKDGLDPTAADVPGAKLYSDGTKLGIGNMVSTALFAGGISYAQALDRTSGLRLEGATVTPGYLTEVIGTLWTAADGERCLTGCIFRSKEPMQARALGTKNLSIGGGSAPGQQGIKDAFGANNLGLLMETWGRYTQIDSTTFTVDDGSGSPVKCVVPSGVVLNPAWQYVSVTGISSCEKVGEELHRLLMVRAQGDIRAF